jgi:hypothetical protein
MRPLPWSARALILCVGVFACNNSTGPVGTSTYVLREVDGDPLPTVLLATELVEVRVLSDTLRLRSDGRGSISGVRETIPLTPDTPAEGPQPITIPFHYQTNGNRIEIAFDCPDLALCIPPPHLIADPDGGLVVHWAPSLRGREPLIYAPVGAL